MANNHRRTSTTIPSSRKPSLALGDTPDDLRDLGHLEMMNREHMLDATVPVQLNRSISTDSLSSISSVANNFGHDFTVGQLEVTLEFEARPGPGPGLLHIALHQGKDLLEREEGDFPGCFIRVTLVPEEMNVGITRVSLGGVVQLCKSVCPLMVSDFFSIFSIFKTIVEKDFRKNIYEKHFFKLF